MFLTKLQSECKLVVFVFCTIITSWLQAYFDDDINHNLFSGFKKSMKRIRGTLILVPTFYIS